MFASLRPVFAAILLGLALFFSLLALEPATVFGLKTVAEAFLAGLSYCLAKLI